MDRQEAARKGGRNVPKEKRMFSRDRALAARAGHKGGQHVPPESRSFSKNRALASEAGRAGGLASQAKLKKQREEQTRGTD